MKKILLFLGILLACVFLDCFLVKELPFSGNEEPSPVLNPQISAEIKCFPIAANIRQKGKTCEYVDSWMAERSFGGERHHEGTDLMTVENRRGIYPVLSMTDGTVENAGWLRLGGYRVGIRSASGTYYYYAHLESYAENLVQGTEVKAGEFLGFVGDTGYGEEGTIGQFAVHLHVGIYLLDAENQDIAVNAYPYLKQAEEKRIYADYDVEP